MKILVWGCGERSRTFINNKYISINDVCGFVDSYFPDDMWCGKKVYRPAEVKAVFIKCNIDYIVITIRDYNVCQEIYWMLKDIGIMEERIMFVYNKCEGLHTLEVHKQDNIVWREIAPKLYEEEISGLEALLKSKCEITKCGYDLIDEKIIIGTEGFNDKSTYMNDYVRFRTFELVANEILQKNLNGAVAEIGVFRGTFAKLLNSKFPDRKLYLYDSFESFRPDEFMEEVKNGNCKEDFRKIFEETDVETLMKKMPYPEKCILRKGYFPESMREEDRKERFVFVSLDVDFEESTYQCLLHMYPLVVDGGYIFLHDYNNHFLGGVKSAVRRFELEKHISLKMVPLSDSGGTMVIVK